MFRRSALRVLRSGGPSFSSHSQNVVLSCVRCKSSAAATSTSSSKDASISKDAISSCPAGTTLSGLNIYKDRAEPVARPDGDYPDWLWTLLDSNTSNTDGVVLESTEGLTKGQARIVEKRNIRAIRAAHRAKQEAASRAASNAVTPSGAGMQAVGQSSQGVVGDAAGEAEAKRADAAAIVDVSSQERLRRRELRAANRENIKALNFVKAR